MVDVINGGLYMGCDIHMHVEYRDSRYGDKPGVWRCGDYFRNTDPTDPNGEYYYVGLYGNRCYRLFAVLANVRNSYPEYPYISAPKGLPEDVSPYVRKDYERWSIDAHSCSYLTLRELIEFKEDEDGVLDELIRRLKHRADEFNIVYGFEWEEPVKQHVYEQAENIRIVFWFDN